MRRKEFLKKVVIVILFISICIVSLFAINKLYKVKKYKNETANMTEEEIYIVNKVIALAEDKIGYEYVWGGKGEVMTKERLDELIYYYGEENYPLNEEEYLDKQAFDCSGLTYWIYKEVTGEEIGYSTYDQEEILEKYEVQEEELQPGDLIYTPGHVVIYKGKGRIIEAQNKYRYPIGGIKEGELYLNEDSVIYRPIDYINSLISE